MVYLGSSTSHLYKGLLGMRGDRSSPHTTPGTLRQPTLFAICIVSRPASATPNRPNRDLYPPDHRARSVSLVAGSRRQPDRIAGGRSGCILVARARTTGA